MNSNFLFGFQIATDVIICAGILFLLIRLRKYLKPESIEVSEKTIEDFSGLLAESRKAGDKFLEELAQEKNALKNLVASIDEREKSLKELLERAMHYVDISIAEKTQEVETADSFSEEPYREILSLARKGLKEEEISQQLNLPEGEIDLILNLSRVKRK